MSAGKYELNFFRNTGEPDSAHCQATLVYFEPCGAKQKPKPCLAPTYGKLRLNGEEFAVCFECYQALVEVGKEVERRKLA